MTSFRSPANDGQNDSPVTPPAPSNTAAIASSAQTQITDDLDQLIAILPAALQSALETHPSKANLIEVVMDLGRRPEVRFPEGAEYLSDQVITQADLNASIEKVGRFGGDNRAGIEQTLHRISAIRNRAGEIIGLTCRVGRAVFGTIGLIRDLVGTGRSILMLGRPGVGKTTALREIARVLADDLQKRVVIIDTSNEIAGDGDIPHPAIGRARRMQVTQPELQHQVMIEAVENHMPEVIVIDEIGTELEALAARTIAERGVQLVGTAHGNRIENLIKNPTLSDLVGGIQSVTLGDDEARRRGSQKSVLERKAPPTFEIAVEMWERQRWVIYEEVADTVDDLLRGRWPNPQVRTLTAAGKVNITHELAQMPAEPASRRPQGAAGWRTSGNMIPLERQGWSRSGAMTSKRPSNRMTSLQHQQFEQLLDRSMPETVSLSPLAPDPVVDLPATQGSLAGQPDQWFEPAMDNDLDTDAVLIYPYGISRHYLDHVVDTLGLPIALTKDLSSAEAVLALRSHVKNHSKLRQLAKSRQLPIHTVKSNTIPQITRALQRILNMGDGRTPEPVDLNLFSRHGSDDELEALEEARLAVEQIVIPNGQPVELLPRSPKVRKMQHELVEHYRLQSSSFGDEPNRRLRIYPA